MKGANELDRQIEEAARLAAEIQETGWGRPFASALEGTAAIAEALDDADGWDEAAMRHEEAMWEAVRQGCTDEAASQAAGLRKCLAHRMASTATAMALCGKFTRDKEGWK